MKIIRLKSFCLPVLVLFIATFHTTALASVAFDCFLKLDGISGNSTVTGHEKEIAILSFQQGFSTTGGSINATNQPKSFTLTLTKSLDATTPLLMLRCADGQHISSAVLACVFYINNIPKDFYKITLTDVVVVSVNTVVNPPAGTMVKRGSTVRLFL